MRCFFPETSVERLEALLAGGGEYAFRFMDHDFRLVKWDGGIACAGPERSLSRAVSLGSPGSPRGFAKIGGLPGLDAHQCLYLGGEDRFIVKLATCHLGAAKDVFASPERHFDFLHRLMPELHQDYLDGASRSAEEALCNLYSSAGYFGGRPVGAAFGLAKFPWRGLVQPLSQGNLEWARGGPFAVATEIRPGKWLAYSLTYGFARAFSKPEHQERLGPPLGPDILCTGDLDAIHPYPGSYQVFAGAILHWDKETNRVWYQTWDGEIREK